MFLLMASPATIEDIGGIDKQWVVLAAAQLFLLGVLAFVFLYYEPLANRRLAWLEWLGMFSACLVMTEGDRHLRYARRPERPRRAEGRTHLHDHDRSGWPYLGLLEVVIFNRRREGQLGEDPGDSGLGRDGVSVTIGALGLFALYITTSMTLDGMNYGYQWLLMAGMVPGFVRLPCSTTRRRWWPDARAGTWTSG